jgi:RNA-directed DNA polymerase
MGFLDWLRTVLFGEAPVRPPSPQVPSRLPSPLRTTPSPLRPSAPRPSAPRPRGPVRLEGLEASQFTPLSHDQVRAQAKSIGPLWGNPWFGRTDLIPPPDDPRTKLIDQALVGHGLITAEELVQIHEVGLEMDKVRPDLALAGRQAEQAVQRSREERQQIKERKKAEAAERKRRHAEDVQRRRATDIVFLGRGVSKGLADRRANVERLQSAGLPILSTPADVAQAMGVTISRLRWLAFHSEASSNIHYVRFSVPKKSGGIRELASPHRDLAGCQEWILENILTKVAVREQAHGFVCGRSTLTNASPHVSAEVVVNADLKDFFPSITFPRVKGAFQSLGYSPAAATILALLCTECPRRTVTYEGQTYHVATGPRGLPQGACTSPALSNIISRRLDVRLAGICAKLGWQYTRYADDLTFSSSGEAAAKVGYLLARVRHIVGEEGFTVNEKKTRVLRRNTAQTVTGIVVNDRTAVSRRTIRRLRAILHRAGKEGLKAQNRHGHPHFLSWLEGMIAYVSMVNPDQGRPLRARLDAILAAG